MTIKSIKHSKATRPHLPSSEEAGSEAASPVVQQGPQRADYARNPVVQRGQDPELFWLGKYGAEDGDAPLNVDIRSLYRHEHIAPTALIQQFYRLTEAERPQEDFLSELFGQKPQPDELEKIHDYYSYQDGWSNRLIQGDSLLVMASLLEREGLGGQVQCIYIDPPYGIKYGSNWQMRINDRTVTDGKDEHLSGEPEQIKAYRDTWELGIHSYLGYLRDRLLLARELLTESGSCFVQISDENVHLVRCLMDEVFGSENFVSQVFLKKTGGLGAVGIKTVADYLIWYTKSIELLKYRQIFKPKELGKGESTGERYDHIESPDGKTKRPMTKEERDSVELVPDGWRAFQLDNLTSGAFRTNTTIPFEFEGEIFHPGTEACWKTTEKGLKALVSANRIQKAGKTIRYKRYIDDFPAIEVTNLWDDMAGALDKLYVVQTSLSVLQRCILMTTDPGDLVLDPTCGSGTTAQVAENWGRRWITIDTSRIALNIAKTRLATARFPAWHLHSDVEVERDPANPRKKPKISPKPEEAQSHDVRQGFVYEQVPHITLKSIANDEPPALETLYDKPYEDAKRLRVAGPFTVETLQNFEPLAPEVLAARAEGGEELAAFEERVFEHLRASGIRNGLKNEQAIFHRVERRADPWLHAEGFYQTARGEAKAYLHIGPKFGTVSRQAVNEAVKACRARGDADWLVILGFSFESDIHEDTVTTSLGAFMVSKARMADDLMQEGLLKNDRKAASFVTIGEPDIAVRELKTAKGEPRRWQVEIQGLDIYDPISDRVNARSVHDISAWMVDHDYDGANFAVRQFFFCGSKDKDEYADWAKGLSRLAPAGERKKAERTLRLEIDEEAFERAYGHQSHPFPVRPGQKVAVRVVSQFGEESTKVLLVSS